MKRDHWMKEAGHSSGECAEALAKAELVAQSKVEKFADKVFAQFAWLALAVGGLLGAVFCSVDVSQLASSHVRDGWVPMIFWTVSRSGGIMVGTLLALMGVEVAGAFVGASFLRRVQRDLYSRKTR